MNSPVTLLAWDMGSPQLFLQEVTHISPKMHNPGMMSRIGPCLSVIFFKHRSNQDLLLLKSFSGSVLLIGCVHISKWNPLVPHSALSSSHSSHGPGEATVAAVLTV
jgi:hypothetical protein